MSATPDQGLSSHYLQCSCGLEYISSSHSGHIVNFLVKKNRWVIIYLVLCYKNGLRAFHMLVHLIIQKSHEVALLLSQFSDEDTKTQQG